MSTVTAVRDAPPPAMHKADAPQLHVTPPENLIADRRREAAR
ncbi:hypothetical protein ACFYXF_37370 [Streptomyces sp. NPDC002680]